MRKKIMTGTEVQQTIRIPKEIHEKITDMAEKERRSFNSEIVLVLQQLLNNNGTDFKASAN
jgi:predicted HicB family RNase H-like nuclease